MTGPRREIRRQRLIFCLLAGCIAISPGVAAGGTSERIVADRYSGLAISGFDPVAYFTDATPREGRDDVEVEAVGAIWRFRNAGNRDAFTMRPDIYAPKFGGYDPVDVARGVPRPGRPQIWMIVDRELYLFGDEANRAAFAAKDASLRQAAQEAWPAVESQLAR